MPPKKEQLQLLARRTEINLLKTRRALSLENVSTKKKTGRTLIKVAKFKTVRGIKRRRKARKSKRRVRSVDLKMKRIMLATSAN